MAKKPIRFGIVGSGMIAEFHGRAIQAMKGGELKAVYGRNPKTAKRLAKQLSCEAYTDYHSFLADAGIDAVTIATPSGAHLEPAEEAAKRGKHIVCEKPLEVTLERIDRMIAVCREQGVVLAGIFPRRFSKPLSLLKKALTDGRFGAITMANAYVKWFRPQSYYDSDSWRGTWQLDGGGALMNQSIHTIDRLYYLMGDVRQISATAACMAHERIEVEDTAIINLKFANGAFGVFQGSTACYSSTDHPARVEICGDQGSVFMEDDSFTCWDFAKKRRSDSNMLRQYGKKGQKAGSRATEPKSIDFSNHLLNFEDAVRAMQGGYTPIVDGAEARKSVEIILAAYQSALKGSKPVSLPLKRTPRRKPFPTGE